MTYQEIYNVFSLICFSGLISMILLFMVVVFLALSDSDIPDICLKLVMGISAITIIAAVILSGMSVKIERDKKNTPIPVSRDRII